jgi:hypothetical protein
MAPRRGGDGGRASHGVAFSRRSREPSPEPAAAVPVATSSRTLAPPPQASGARAGEAEAWRDAGAPRKLHSTSYSRRASEGEGAGAGSAAAADAAGTVDAPTAGVAAAGEAKTSDDGSDDDSSGQWAQTASAPGGASPGPGSWDAGAAARVRELEAALAAARAATEEELQRRQAAHAGALEQLLAANARASHLQARPRTDTQPLPRRAGGRWGSAGGTLTRGALRAQESLDDKNMLLSRLQESPAPAPARPRSGAPPPALTRAGAARRSGRSPSCRTRGATFWPSRPRSRRPHPSRPRPRPRRRCLCSQPWISARRAPGQVGSRPGAAPTRVDSLFRRPDGRASRLLSPPRG